MALTLFNVLYKQIAASGVVATKVGTRIYESMASDDRLPAITIEVELEEDEALDARPANHYTVTIEVEALTEGDRKVITDAIITAINRQRWTDDNVEVASCKLIGESRSSSSEGGNPEVRYFVAEQTYAIIAKE